MSTVRVTLLPSAPCARTTKAGSDTGARVMLDTVVAVSTSMP
jgi:hypothetical protein